MGGGGFRGKKKPRRLVAKLKICALVVAAAVATCCTENTAAASGWLRDRTHTSGCRLRPLMQIFANLLRWLVQGGARKAHVKRADDLLKKLSRSLSSK